ncbi:MAG: hypothetical protein OJF49_003685 [Ktedonobacterales bacterium]|jgi:glycosyltransferase involved in cell wall biosynthesis|nr:MAG: hypothetical protein OJF49_003685 [Ktedonobacterales bacterium]
MTQTSDAAADMPLLSLIIPAFNEQARLPRTLRLLRRYFRRHPLAVEVLVVDDGSTDATAAIVAHRARHWSALRLLRAEHGGKGSAVRAGLLAARGAYSFICDADFSMPVTELAKFLPLLPQTELAIGTREGPAAHRYGEPLHRHLMGRVFNGLVRAAVLPDIQDTQCGFKCLRADIGRRLAAAQTISGFGFDVELLYLARRWGYRVVEVPIEWYYAPSSHISPLRDTWGMTRDVLRVRRNARLGRYDTLPTPATALATPPDQPTLAPAPATIER